MTDVLADDVAQWMEQRRHRDPVTGLRQHGQSSDALAMYAVGVGALPLTDQWGWAVEPSDPSDLAACELTYRKAPERLRPRMLPVLEAWRAHVAARYSLDDLNDVLDGRITVAESERRRQSRKASA